MASKAKFYSRSHKSPMFTVESTKNFMYQTVMRLCYKPGKIFPDTPWKAKLSFLFFRSHYRTFSSFLQHWIIYYQAPVVQKVDSAIRWINHYPVYNLISLCNTYLLDSHLSGG